MSIFTVLIAEDDSMLRMHLALIVRGGGYTVCTAADGEEACAALATTAIDIVLSDVAMPRMNGYALLDWIRERDYPQPVIMISGYDKIQSAIAALRRGAYDYITKPFHADDVQAALRRAAASVAARRSDADLRQRNRELNALTTISAAVSSSLDLSPMLQQAMTATIDVLGMGGALIYLTFLSNRLHLHSSYGVLYPLPLWPPHSLRITGEQNVAIGTAQVAQMLESAYDDLGRQIPSDTLEALIPLMVQGELRGLVLLSGPSRRPVQHDQLGLLQSISHIIGAGVTNSRTYGAVYNSALLLEEQIGQRTQELQRSRDLLRTIFDGIPGGLVLLDTNGTILAVNRAYADLLGQEPQPMVGRTYATIWPEALRSDSQDLLHRCIADATPLSQRTRLDRPDQSPVVLDRHLFPVHSNTGTDTVQVIEYLDDVTERLALERVIAQTEQLAALGKLAATVAHEVNTPLLAIRGCVSLAASSTDEATRTEYLGLAQVELERAASIIRDMLDFYRPAGSQQVSVDINGLVGQVLQLLRAECAHREIVVLPHLAPYLSNVVGAPDQLKQVLLNLVLNAIEAMSPAGGTLTVTTSIREPEPGVIVTISDTGPGIPASILNRIFDAFVTTKSDGNGLGLAVCRTILADHDGLLTAANLPAGGACFTMVLTRTTDSPR